MFWGYMVLDSLYTKMMTLCALNIVVVVYNTQDSAFG